MEEKLFFQLRQVYPSFSDEEWGKIVASKVTDLINEGLDLPLAASALADQLDFDRLPSESLQLYRPMILDLKEQMEECRRNLLIFRQQLLAFRALEPIARKNEIVKNILITLLERGRDQFFSASDIFGRVAWALENSRRQDD